MVTIVYGWHDDNKGDSAITLGLIEILGRLGVKNVIIVSLVRNAINYNNTIYDLKQYLTSLNIKCEAIPGISYTFTKNAVLNKLRILVEIMREVLITVSPNFFRFLLSENERLVVSKIRDSRLLMAKGGHIFLGTSWKFLPYLFNVSFYLLLSKRLKKTVIISPQSFGPFGTYIGKKIMKWVIRSVDLIMCREETSIKLLKELEPKTSTDKILFFPDLAFNPYIKGIKVNNSPSNIIKQKNLLKIKGSIGITVRQLNFTSNSQDEYLLAISKLCEDLIESGEKITIFPHVIGPIYFEDDRQPSKKLYSSLANRYPDSVFLFNDKYDALELAYYYSLLKIMIGTRFHSVIFSLREKVPAFAISYNGPKADIMNLFGMKEYMIDKEDVTLKNVQDMFIKVSRLIKEREELSNSISKTIDKLDAFFDTSYLINIVTKLAAGEKLN